MEEMNNMKHMNKVFVLLVAGGMAFALLGGTQAQPAGALYGTQVVFGDDEFAPDLTLTGDLEEMTDTSGVSSIVRWDGASSTSMTDDVFVLDIDTSGDISLFDLILFNGHSSKGAGSIVGVTDETLLGKGSAYAIQLVYVDVNENGFYDSEDWVYVTTDVTEDAVTAADHDEFDLESTQLISGADTFSLRITPNAHGAFGSLVRTTDRDYQDWRTMTSSDFDGDGSDDASQFAFFDRERDAAWQGSEGDVGYIVPVGGVSTGDLVPQFSIRVFGVDNLGSFVEVEASEFRPRLTELPAAGSATTLSDMGVIRHGAGTTTNSHDDVFILDVDDDGEVSQYDIVLATGGYAGTSVGYVIGVDDVLLIDSVAGGTATDFDGVEVAVFWADVDENGFFNIGDYVYVCGEDTADPGDLVSTNADRFCIRLTAASGGAAGTTVRVGDSDLNDYDGTVTEDDFEAGFFDIDNDGIFQGVDDEMVWFVHDLADGADDASGFDDGDLVPMFAIQVIGGTFGHQVQLGDSEFVPTLVDLGEPEDDFEVVRYDPGTPNDPFDDVFVLDMITDDDDINQNELVIATGGFGGVQVGELVPASASLLLGKGTSVSIDVFIIDINENGFYDQGDWVYICDDSGDGLHGTSGAGDFCIRMTETDGGAAGTLVRQNDQDRRDWGYDDIVQPGHIYVEANLAYFDQDGNGAFDHEGGDLLYLVVDAEDVFADGDRVQLYSLRLWGDYSALPPGGGGPGSSTTTTTTTTTSSTTTTTTTSESSTTTTTSPSGSMSSSSSTGPSGSGTTTGTGTPGFELVALVAALGAALVLVRRRN